ncbi:LacI family DNA-binding transcriptional regulator [Nocardia jiangxiensis]|uniref:LacI family DNA-binding transcriptional regulator n=1 Tax=Nocardia jiangxiensis TaxID=282685 RepID=A0ABW6SCE5_9NOCA|nr:LacI family DNA-binding transcriptional regulator [Nocardia jiangxiensis]
MVSPRRPVTIYDVADAAGVATSTVSRAFSRPGRVSAETAARVRAAAAELGYRTEAAHRAMPSGGTGTIAVVVSNIANPYYFRLIESIQSAAQAAGVTTAVFDAQESGEIERDLLNRLLPIADGVVVSGSRISDRAMRTVAEKMPVVVLNRPVQGLSCLVPDISVGVRATLAHLRQLGHRMITYVGGPAAAWSDGHRWRTILDNGSRLGMKVNRIGPYPPTIAGGRSAARKILHYPPTAVLTFNDLLAMGVIRGLDAAGVGVPGDISVVGVGDIFGADFHAPPLTTVAAPLRAVGAAAFAELSRLMRGAPPSRNAAFGLEAQLIIRGSTGPSGAHRRTGDALAGTPLCKFPA